jgi:hypothetical protein
MANEIENWTGGEILECTSFGKMWVVADVKTNRVRCRRIRRNQKIGLFVKEEKWFKGMGNLGCGDLLFFDAHNVPKALTPVGELAQKLDVLIKNREI